MSMQLWKNWNLQDYDWVDKGSHYEINIDCQGYKPENLKIEIDDRTHVLSVKGVQRFETRGRNGSVSKSFSEFSKTITLPPSAKHDTLRAKMNMHTIVIHVEKQQRHNPIRRIPIQ